jgi:methyltransferase (TIGR00027 family)
MSWALGGIALEQKSRSITAEGVAIQRALHQTLDAAPKILDDPIAPLLLDLESDGNKAFIARVESITRPVSSPFRAVFIMRSRFAEDCLAESLVRGVLQYVILGAGLDTFAYRQPPWAGSLRIYEVDHPASQEWKRERLEVANVKVPENLIFAPIDFETTSLREGLSASGFDFRLPSCFSLLGVTQYLRAQAIESIFRLAQSLLSGSEIVFEIIVPDDLMPTNEAAVFAAIAAVAAERGEPWLTRLRPEEVTSMLLTLGFSKVTHLSPQGADERYFGGRSDDLAAWSGAQMMRAIV